MPGIRLGGKGGAIYFDFDFEDLWLLVCMLYLRLKGTFFAAERAEERQAAEFTWSKPEPFRR